MPIICASPPLLMVSATAGTKHGDRTGSNTYKLFCVETNVTYRDPTRSVVGNVEPGGVPGIVQLANEHAGRMSTGSP